MDFVDIGLMDFVRKHFFNKQGNPSNKWIKHQCRHDVEETMNDSQ